MDDRCGAPTAAPLLRCTHRTAPTALAVHPPHRSCGARPPHRTAVHPPHRQRGAYLCFVWFLIPVCQSFLTKTLVWCAPCVFVSNDHFHFEFQFIYAKSPFQILCSFAIAVVWFSSQIHLLVMGSRLFSTRTSSTLIQWFPLYQRDAPVLKLNRLIELI